MNELNYLKQIIDSVKLISDETIERRKKSGSEFNIFKVLNLENKEVPIVRFLLELLNPNGCHYQGDYFLKSFIRNALSIDEEKIGDDELIKAKVRREVSTIDNKRIDLTIETKSTYIGIEIKVYSHEHDHQLQFYSKELNRSSKHSYLYYLTPFGEESLELDKNKYEPMSFKDDIIPWLIEAKNGLDDTLIRLKLNLDQYICVLKNICGIETEETTMKVKDYILESEDNLKCVKTLINALPKAQTQIMLNFFNGLKEELIDHSIEFDKKIFSCNEEDIKKYYESQKRVWPSINIKFLDRQKDKINHDIYLRLEVDYRLFIGFIVSDTGEKDVKIIDKKTKELFSQVFDDMKVGGENNWWLVWKYIMIENEWVDFKSFNDNVIKLANKNNLTQLIKICVETIETLLKEKEKVLNSLIKS